jgi:hypothetical protein
MTMRLLGGQCMNFKNKYMIRNKTLNILSCFCGLTSLTLAYTFIRWQKIKYYNERMFENIDLTEWNSISWLIDNYFQIGGLSVFLCLLLALIIDLLVMRFFIGR